MALPVTIPNEFASATASIPLSQLDTNFTTLANAVNGISDGSETLANASVTVLTAGTANVTTLNTSGQVVFNDAGADVDFRVEGDTNANLLFVDASADTVGIGTSSPNERLVVNGAIRSTNNAAGATATADSGVFYFIPTADAPSDPRTVLQGVGTASVGASVVFYTGTSASNSERMRVTSDGYLRLAGGGIQFNGDTAAANALDDYEEGTFTATMSPETSGTITLAAASNELAYTKIGRVVTVTGNINISAVGSPVGTFVNLSGLPFTSADLTELAGRIGGAVTFNDSAPTNLYLPQPTLMLESSTEIRIIITAANITANDAFFVSFSYFST